MEYTRVGLSLATNGLLPFLVFGAILLMVRVGWFVGNKTNERSKGSKTSTDDTLVSAILGLMALVMAFTFSGASDRLDAREHLKLAEVNSISSAISSADYFNEDERSNLRCLIKTYLDERIVLYQDYLKSDDFSLRQSKAESILNQIRIATLQSAKQTPTADRNLANEAIKTVNIMLDAYDNQRQAMFLHPPNVIWVSLIILVLIGSFLSGYKMGLTKKRERFISFMFAALMSSAIYLTISLEFPQLGNISLEPFAHEFLRLQHGFVNDVCQK